MSTFGFQQLVKFGVCPSRAAQISHRMSVRALEDGEELMPLGSSTQDWFMVISGHMGCCLSARHAGSGIKDQPIELFGPNAWIGTQLSTAFTEFLPAYRCVRAAQLLVMPGDLITRLMANEVDFAAALAERVLGRAQRNMEASIASRYGSFALRTFMVLAHLVEDCGKTFNNGPRNPSQASYAVPLSQTQFAHLIGISRTCLSECLQALQSEGFVSLGYGEIEVHELSGWTGLLKKLRQSGLECSNMGVADLVRELNLACRATSRESLEASRIAA